MSASETCEIAFIKDGMSGSEKDAGFCSGEDENLHSPSGSEDSVEVQISPISLRNKRKLAEPKKTLKTDPNRPLKKRRFIERTGSPFRPWSAPEKGEEDRWKAEEERRRGEEVQRLYEARIHAQVLARLQVVASGQENLSQSSPEPTPSPKNLQTSGFRADHIRAATPHPSNFVHVASAHPKIEIRTDSLHSEPTIRTKSARLGEDIRTGAAYSTTSISAATSDLEPRIRTTAAQSDGGIRTAVLHSGGGVRPASTFRPHADSPHQEEPLALVLREGRVPPHPGVSELPYEEKIPRDTRSGKIPSSRMSSTSGALSEQSGTGHSQRNYKNMTRERRIEANARERTRVHTISAAFNTLRRSIPAYSHNQKLSKLSVLRIACSYIMTLSKIVTEGEENVGVEGIELGECVDLVSRTIQTEGKLRKKKDE